MCAVYLVESKCWRR